LTIVLVVATIASALLLALVLFSAYLCWRALHPRVIPLLKTYQIEVEHGRLNEKAYRAWPKEEVKIRSPLGYYLAATYFPQPDARHTLIYAHGHGYSRFGGIRLVPFFHRLGFNVLLFDQRGHGLSGGTTCTYGYFERHDLKALTTWALERLGPNGKVGTMGESLGAAACLLHAALDPRVSFVIADSPYARLEEVFQRVLQKDYHLPLFPFYPLTSVMCRIFSRFSPRQVAPVEVMPVLHAPVLLIHGSADDLIPLEAAQQLWHAAPEGQCLLYVVEGAGHVEAYTLNPAAYFERIETFLRSFNLIEPAPVGEAPPPPRRRRTAQKRHAESIAFSLANPAIAEPPHPAQNPPASGVLPSTTPEAPDKETSTPVKPRRGRPRKGAQILPGGDQAGGMP